MAMAGFFGQVAAGIGQKNRAIRLAADKFFAHKPRNGLDDRNVRYAQPPGDIDRPCLTIGFDQFGDDFDIILGDFRQVCFARSAMIFGLLLDTAPIGGVAVFGIVLSGSPGHGRILTETKRLGNICSKSYI